ncbi:MAG: glycosyltransferase [Alistipes sp.]
MKALFLVFHGFSDYSGISKKIFDQCEALRCCGVDTQLCYIRIDADGTQRRLVGNGSKEDFAVDDFGRGLQAKIAKRLCFNGLTHYIRAQQIDLLYVRYDHNANPVLIRWFKQIQRLGVKIALEIPTYPYDQEFSQASRRAARLKHLLDRCFRHRLAQHVDRIVTFSNHAEIFGRPTICISNGIDFSRIPLKTKVNDTSHEVNLLGVANIHFWHGFDRVIEGLKNYYATTPTRQVNFHIVGDGSPALIQSYQEAVSRHNLEQHIFFHGPQSGTALDALFEACDFGIASLGRHRSGISNLKTLKNREYAARGISFVYSEQDDDFDTMPYVLKVPAEDAPLDIGKLLHFVDQQTLSPTEIRASIEETLSWKSQMHYVVQEFHKNKMS